MCEAWTIDVGVGTGWAGEIEMGEERGMVDLGAEFGGEGEEGGGELCFWLWV